MHLVWEKSIGFVWESVSVQEIYGKKYMLDTDVQGSEKNIAV